MHVFKVNFIARILALQLTQTALEPHPIAAPQPTMIGKHLVSEKVRPDSCWLYVELPLMQDQTKSLQKTGHLFRSPPQPALVIAEERQIIGIADIARRAQHFFHEMVEGIEIQVGEKLTGQVPDGDPSPAFIRCEEVVPRKIVERWILRITVPDNALREP